MRILAVVYCYPPMLVPASICYAKLVHGLVRSGVEVDVVRIDPQTFDSPGTPLDESLLPHLPSEVRHHVVRSPEKSLLVRALNRVDARHRFTWRWLEPRKREWTFAALRALRGVGDVGYDAVLTCSQPNANHLLGLELKRRLGVPWVAYFSDPWIGNPYARYRTEHIARYQRELEARVLREADRVLFTCEEMRQFVVGRSKELEAGRTGVVPHAFVPEWYRAAPPAGPRSADEGVRLVHTGSFYGPRTPRPLIEALERLGGAAALQGKLRIAHFGGMAEADRQEIGRRGLDAVIDVKGFVPYLESLSRMAEADGLLLVDAPLSDAAQSVFLPSKLIDYLGAGRPVVAVTPRQGATARVVRETGGTLCDVDDSAELAQALGSIVEAGEIRTPRDEAAAAAYEDGAVGATMLAELERATATTSAG